MSRPSRVVALGILLALVLGAGVAHAQTSLTGRAVDAVTGEALPGANVVATRLAPDSVRVGAAANADGQFRLSVAAGTYRLRVSYAGYTADTREVVARGPIQDVGDVALVPAALGEVEVGAVRERVTLRGDTTAFNAAAFPVNPDASAEDLVARLPGVTVENGTVTAQGETVRRVLVDGEEFFGTDPTAALRNLPADMIAEIQVFDRASDQSRFTGFDDGNAETTINIVTRTDRRAGQFGRVYGGGGADGAGATVARYATGATVHTFSGARRLSIIGQANNVNQQNFASEDLLGVLGQAGDRGGRGGGGPRGGGRGGDRGGRGGADASTYLVGEQGGITNTAALGLNYSDRWGGDVRVSGSYFANRTRNDTDAFLSRDYVVADSLFYTQSSLSETTNWNHRVSGRLEATLSPSTQLTATPRLSVQTNRATSALSGLSTLLGDASQTQNSDLADGLGVSGSLDVLLRHRFGSATPAEGRDGPPGGSPPGRRGRGTPSGRTLSLRLGISQNGQLQDTDQDVLSLAGADTTDAFQRRIDGTAGTRRLSADLTYTEPLGSRAQLQLSVEPSVATSSSGQDALRFDPLTGGFTAVDSSFTSQSDQRLTTGRGGVDLNYAAGPLRLSAGVDAEVQQLAYTQAGLRAFEVDRTTTTLLPSASARYEISETTRLDLRYRASSRTPSVTQLRDVVDDTNPLLVTAGNPDLALSRDHRVDLRLRATQPTAGSVLFGSLQLTATEDYVGSATTVAGARPVVVRGVTLAPGAQFTAPVNLGGYLRARAFGVVGRPVHLLRSNANLTGGVTYTRTPSLYNGLQNRADAVALDLRTFLSTAVSPRFDARLSYALAWTTVSNTVLATANDAYLTHRAGLGLNWLPSGGLVVATDFNLTAYSGVAAGQAPTAAVWNVGVGHKFLAGDRAEVRLTAYDVLNRNAAVNQSVTDTYVETAETQALGRYVMLNVSYRLNNLGAATRGAGR